jgi:hypothetical protein
MYERRPSVLGVNSTSCNFEYPHNIVDLKTILQLKERRNDYGQ